MTELRKKGSSDSRFKTVSKTILNPKSINLAELYGWWNDANVWEEGIISKTLRSNLRLKERENKNSKKSENK